MVAIAHCGLPIHVDRCLGVECGHVHAHRCCWLGHDFAYFQRPQAKLRAGIWRSTAYTEKYDNYPSDEFMVLLKGEVTLEYADTSETFRQGDAFLVPKGFQGVWRQPVDVLKFYVIVE